MSATASQRDDAASVAPFWEMPGPLVRRFMGVLLLAVVLAAVGTAWVVSQIIEQDSLQRLVQQQNDEVQLYARLLAGKIEQNQKILSSTAAAMTPVLLQVQYDTGAGRARLASYVQHEVPLARFFDSLVLLHPDGQVLLHWHHGRSDSSAPLEARVRDALYSTLRDGRPLVSGPVGGASPPVAVLLTQPLHSEEGRLLAVLGASVRMQSQALLPPAMALPQQGESRLMVFNREGTILLHPEPTRILGKISDEPDLAPLYGAQGQVGAFPAPSSGSAEGGQTHLLESVIVSAAEMPLPQWWVARVSHRPISLAQPHIWVSVGGALLLWVLALWWLMAWWAQPLARLQQCCRTLLSCPQARACRAVEPQLRCAPGEVGALAQVLHTVLEQRAQLYQENQRLTAQMQAVFQHCPVGVAMVQAGQLQWLGRQACEMLGYHSPEALRALSVRRLHPPDVDFGRLQQRVRLAFAAYGCFDGDMCLQRQDGTTLWVRAQAHPFSTVQQTDAGVAGATVWFLEDLTAAREAQHLQDWASLRDGLTLLPNRAALEQRLSTLLVQHGSSANADRGADAQPPANTPVGMLLFLDLDHFSVVNEEAGHEAGNDVLRHVARLLGGQVRHTGWVARVGGDKFAVLLPRCSVLQGQEAAEKICTALSAWQPSYQGRSFVLGASIGMVALDAPWQSVAHMLHVADMTCYAAKRAGRNRVVFETLVQTPPSPAH